MRRFSRFLAALAASLSVSSVAGWCLFAVAVPPAAADDTPQWRSPLSGSPQVLRRFEPPETPWSAGHRGVDLPARPGQPVYAAGPGQVGYAGMVAGRGVVTVVHGSLRTTYLPVDASVRVGQRVGLGDRLGVLEHRVAHCEPDHCLHWGLLRGSEYLDPLALIGVGGVRLLPFWGKPTPSALDPGGPSPAGGEDSEERARPAGGPARSSPPGNESQSSEPEFSLVGSVAVGSGSAVLTGLAMALGALFARRRTRRPSPLPTGVIDLGREREARRLQPHADGDRPPC